MATLDCWFSSRAGFAVVLARNICTGSDRGSFGVADVLGMHGHQGMHMQMQV